MDVEFLFSCSTWYLTRSLRSLARYKVEHKKSTSISATLLFTNLLKTTFLMISRRFLTTLRRFWKSCPKDTRFPNIFPRFPKIAEHFGERSEDHTTTTLSVVKESRSGKAMIGILFTSRPSFTSHTCICTRNVYLIRQRSKLFVLKWRMIIAVNFPI